MNATRYNPRYKISLPNDELGNLIDKAIYPFRSFEKKVYYATMWKDHEQQIRERVEAKAKLMKDMNKAKRWKNKVYRTFEEYSSGYKGYSYNRKKGSLEMRFRQHRTFNLSSNNTFSGSIESVDRVKRAGGYIASILALALALGTCYMLYKTLPRMIDTFDPPTTTIEDVLFEK